MTAVSWTWKQRPGLTSVLIVPETEEPQNAAKYCLLSGQEQACSRITCFSCTPIQKRKKRYKVLSQNLYKLSQHSCSVVKVLNSASEMKILQYVTDLWTMNITFYKEKLNPLSSLMTGATYWCKKQTAIVLVSDRQRNAASQKLSSPMILALYFIHVWTGVTLELCVALVQG